MSNISRIEPGDGIWCWAVRAFENPQVAKACQALQTKHGQSIAFLMWSAWGVPDLATSQQAAEIAKTWDAAVLAPLRLARKGLKFSNAAIVRKALDELREEIVASELLGERVLIEALARLRGRGSGDRLEALIAATAIWGLPAPTEALQRLASAF